MSSILDLVTGGGLLPHVYCRKIVLERSAQSSNLVDITLQLEILQSADSLSSSSWLNNLSTQGVNFLDSMFIQVLQFERPNNVVKLMPSTNPTNQDSPGNIYVAKQILGDAYLPRGNNYVYGAFGTEEVVKGTFPEDTMFQAEESPLPNPIQVSNSSLLGEIAGASGLQKYESQGRIRKEIIEGKSYFVIPFEHKVTGYDPKPNVKFSERGNLGFAFYAFLNVPYWLQNLDIGGTTLDPNLYNDMFEKLIVEGPVNSEVVFKNGKLRQTREAFFLPNGLAWEGSVHLHASSATAGQPLAPAPDGYAGDGGISGKVEITDTGEIANFGDEFRGWMVGEKHIGPNQAKLRLLEVPNNKIVDFRSALFPEPLDEALGLGTKTNVFNLNPDVTKIENMFLSPFQKEKRKEHIKDNDSEYSKLYMSRDRHGRARGMFFIDTIQLLRNNSSLFPVLFDQKMPGSIGEAQGIINDFDAVNILQKSKILQIRLYRDRVKKHVINNRYENYSNDEMYEEPSKLIATIGDVAGFKTPANGGSLSEIDGVLNSAAGELSNIGTRFFMFNDKEMSELSAGAYQYRIEVDFKDGTYDFLSELLKDLHRTKALIDEYYELSISSFSTFSVLKHNLSSTEPNQLKASFTKYYNNGSFTSEFLDKVNELTTDTPTKPAVWKFKPWNRAGLVLDKVQRIFGLFPGQNSAENVQFNTVQARNMISPSPENPGSPRGIEFYSRLLSVSITKIESLLGATKVNKTGNELATAAVENGFNYNTLMDFVITPSDCTIKEKYSFDHPNEIFHATSNKNIFMDYLSIGNPLLTGFNGLRSIRTDYFVNRCRLEAAKFSPVAKWLDRFNRSGTEPVQGNIGLAFLPAGTGGPKLIPTPDSFSNTGYSYLAPSMVMLADPIQEMEAYNFLYSAFKPQAVEYLDNPNVEASMLHSPLFYNWVNYDKLFISLYNYSVNKKENPDADLTDAFTSAPHDDAFQQAMLSREPYKRTLEEIGITIHDSFLYDGFFEKESGAVSVQQETSQRTEPLPPYSYSDGILNPTLFCKKYIFTSKQSVIKLKGNSPTPESYSVTLPNSMKLYQIDRTHKITFGSDNGLLHPEIEKAFGENTATNPKYNNFLFFNVNLTAKIEVFRGIEGITSLNATGNPIVGAISKADENSWSLLTEADLSLNDSEKLFCRIVLYDKSLAKNMQLPIIDEYFLIYNNAKSNVPPLIPMPNLTETAGEILSFWELQGQAKANQKKLASGDALQSAGNLNLQIDANTVPALSIGISPGGSFQTPGQAGTPSPASAPTAGSGLGGGSSAGGGFSGGGGGY